MSEDKLDYLTKDEPKDTPREDYLKPVESKFPNPGSTPTPESKHPMPRLDKLIKDEPKDAPREDYLKTDSEKP